MMDTNYFVQRIQCSRSDKETCLQTVAILMEITYAAQKGVKALDEHMETYRQQYTDRFMNKAVQLYMDAKNVEQIRTILYNTVISSNFSGQQFLQAVIITETMAALFEQRDIDFIFTYLIPSYFGMDFEAAVIGVYHACKKRKMMKEHSDESFELTELDPV